VLGFSDAAGTVSAGQVPFILTTGFPPQFVGFGSDAGLLRVDITFQGRPGTSFLSIDDFRFEGITTVPEPATMALIAIGLAGVAGRTWRTRR
jgi:hypothetical protein